MNFINLKINYSYLLNFFKEILFKENFLRFCLLELASYFLKTTSCLSIYLDLTLN